MLNVTVKTLDSQNHSFSVHEGILVKEFKEEITVKIDIPVELQKLIFCGRVLQDDKKLADYDVHEKVVHLVRKQPDSNSSNQQPPDQRANISARHRSPLGIPADIHSIGEILYGAINQFTGSIRQQPISINMSGGRNGSQVLDIQFSMNDPRLQQRPNDAPDPIRDRLFTVDQLLTFVNNSLNELSRESNIETRPRPTGAHFVMESMPISPEALFSGIHSAFLHRNTNNRDTWQFPDQASSQPPSAARNTTASASASNNQGNVPASAPPRTATTEANATMEASTSSNQQQAPTTATPGATSGQQSNTSSATSEPRTPSSDNFNPYAQMGALMGSFVNNAVRGIANSANGAVFEFVLDPIFARASNPRPQTQQSRPVPRTRTQSNEPIQTQTPAQAQRTSQSQSEPESNAPESNPNVNPTNDFRVPQARIIPPSSSSNVSDSSNNPANSSAQDANRPSQRTINNRLNLQYFARMVQEIRMTQSRLDRFLEIFYNNLLGGSNRRPSAIFQLRHRSISRAMHHLGHAYHLLSELQANIVDREVDLYPANDPLIISDLPRPQPTAATTQATTVASQAASTTSQATPAASQPSTATPQAASTSAQQSQFTEAASSESTGTIQHVSRHARSAAQRTNSSNQVVNQERMEVSPVHDEDSDSAEDEVDGLSLSDSPSRSHTSSTGLSGSDIQSPTTSTASSSTTGSYFIPPSSIFPPDRPMPAIAAMSNTLSTFNLDPFLACNSNWRKPEVRGVYDIHFNNAGPNHLGIPNSTSVFRNHPNLAPPPLIRERQGIDYVQEMFGIMTDGINANDFARYLYEPDFNVLAARCDPVAGFVHHVIFRSRLPQPADIRRRAATAVRQMRRRLSIALPNNTHVNSAAVNYVERSLNSFFELCFTLPMQQPERIRRLAEQIGNIWEGFRQTVMPLFAGHEPDLLFSIFGEPAVLSYHVHQFHDLLSINATFYRNIFERNLHRPTTRLSNPNDGPSRASELNRRIVSNEIDRYELQTRANTNRPSGQERPILPIPGGRRLEEQDSGPRFTFVPRPLVISEEEYERERNNPNFMSSSYQGDIPVLNSAGSPPIFLLGLPSHWTTQLENDERALRNVRPAYDELSEAYRSGGPDPPKENQSGSQ